MRISIFGMLAILACFMFIGCQEANNVFPEPPVVEINIVEETEGDE